MPIYRMKGIKDGKQKYRVRINYTDSSGENKQMERVAYGKEEAKELERELQYQIKKAPVSTQKTVRKLYDEYIKASSGRLRESSLQKAKSNLKAHVLPTLGSVKLNKLKPALLQKWKNEMEEKETAKGEKLSLTTKQNIFQYFNAMLNFAITMEYIPDNPLKKIGNFKSSTEPKKEMDYYIPEEYKKYAAAALRMAQNDKTNRIYNFYTFFSIAFYTGLRKGEINALKWSDINGNYLTVSRSISQKLKGADRETPPKNKSSHRTLQIPEPLMNILDEQKERQKQFDNFSDDFRVCGGIDPLRDTSIDQANRTIANAAGVKRIRVHDFRHSHASLLANNGINIQEIARRLGHSDVQITWNTYAHLYPKEEERAIAILNKIS